MSELLKTPLPDKIIKAENLVFGASSVLYFTFNTYFLPHGISLILIFGVLMIPIVFLRQQQFRFIVLYLIFLSFSLLLYKTNFIYISRSSVLFLGFAGLFFLLKGFLSRCKSISGWIDGLSFLNVLLILIFLFLKYTEYREWVWWTFFLSSSIGEFTRLKGFGYEPSYFAFSLVPLVLFYFSKLLSRQIRIFQVFLLSGLLLGLAMAFSLGVILGLLAAIALSCLFFLYSADFVEINRKKIGFTVLAALLFLPAALVIFPDSPLVVRLSDLFNGKDPSGNSRLLDSFILSFEILSQKNVWIGLGPGQLKIDGFQIIKDFYNYTYLDSWAPAMPNSITDWLCNFGIIGVVAKLATELFLFVKTRVFRDFFRFSSFVFIFIYQFTGGFLNCLPELVLWALAFYAPNHFEFGLSPKFLNQRPLNNISVIKGLVLKHRQFPFLVYGSFILFGLGFFISNAFLSVSSILLLLSLGFFRSFFRQSVLVLTSPFFWVQAAFFALTLFSVLWSTNQAEAWIEVQSKLPFLFFPLFLHPHNPVLKRSFSGMLRLFFLFGILISVLCLLQVICTNPLSLVFDFLSYERLSFVSGLQPIYLSYYLIFSILSGYFLWKSNPHLQKWLYLSGIVFLFVMVVLLSSRTEVIVLCILSLTALLDNFKKQKIWFLGSAMGLLSLVAAIILISPTNRQRFSEMLDFQSTYKENKWGGRDLRITKWRFTLEASRENLWLGTGAGDYWNSMEAVYQKHRFEIGLKEKFNSHNQYLQTLLTLGIPGLCIMLVFFFSMLRRAKESGNMLLLAAALTIALSMITESLWERQAGVFLSVFFANLFFAASFFDKKRIENQAVGIDV
jgi:O-antigen ligase